MILPPNSSRSVVSSRLKSIGRDELRGATDLTRALRYGHQRTRAGFIAREACVECRERLLFGRERFHRPE